MNRSRRLFMTADAVGGVWRYATDLAGELTAQGHEVVLALLGPPPTPAQRAQVASASGPRLIETGLPLDWLARDEAAVREAARAIAALARAERADLIQLNQPALAAEPMPAPVVAVMHSCVATWWAAAGQGPMPESFGWQTGLVRAGLANAERIVCPSAAFARAVQAAYRLPALPNVVHNGRAALATGDGAQHDFAFTAGRLWDRGKNVATLDRAAARLGVPLKAAGPTQGPNGDRIALEHIHAMGVLGDAALAGCLSARPVFVSAARYEPFGLAILEAAQAGCPLVLADIPTFRELWGDVATFVPPDDEAGFARAIEALIGDATLRLARGDLARRHAARFSLAAMAAGMADIYRSLDARKAAA